MVASVQFALTHYVLVTGCINFFMQFTEDSEKSTATIRADLIYPVQQKPNAKCFILGFALSLGQ